MAAANNGNEHVRSVEELKSAFKEGATPNEKDYGALIDLAAVGSKALGATDKTPTTPNPGLGLKMDGKGKLTVSAGNGVTVDQNGVAVKGDEKSVTVSKTGVSIKVKENGGLATDAGTGLHVNTGTGLKTDDTGLAIKLADKSGLRADTQGLAVNVAAGLDIDEKGALEVNLKKGADNYITSDKDGLAITRDGVTAIEQALKSVSLQALQKADETTNHGFKTYSKTAESDSEVEKKIAEKLNEAFREGWHLTQPREALFRALQAFRSTNKAKIYNDGLIAPSAVTGYPGLYNQKGVEYRDGAVIALMVGAAGEPHDVKGVEYKEKDGIYALVGKLDTNGDPNGSDTYDKVTPQALMVLVAQKVVTVVGHWDFISDTDWTGPTSGPAWRTGPPIDGVVKHEEDAQYVENTTAIAALKQKIAEKETEMAAAIKQAESTAKATAAAAPRFVLGGKTMDMIATRSGRNLELRPSSRVNDTFTMQNETYYEDDGNRLVSIGTINFSAYVYGQRLGWGKLSGSDDDGTRGQMAKNHFSLINPTRTSERWPADHIRKIECRDFKLRVELVWVGVPHEYIGSDYRVEFSCPDGNFKFEMDGPAGGIHTIFRFE